MTVLLIQCLQLIRGSVTEASRLRSKYHQAIFPGESPDARQRMPEVFDAFEKLEKDLRQHIEMLRVSRWERVASKLRSLPTAPK
jgi:hypothetical protein